MAYFGTSQVFVVKLNSSLAIQWVRMYSATTRTKSPYDIQLDKIKELEKYNMTNLRDFILYDKNKFYHYYSSKSSIFV